MKAAIVIVIRTDECPICHHPVDPGRVERANTLDEDDQCRIVCPKCETILHVTIVEVTIEEES